MENACDEAGLEYSDLDKILLVGGSTRMPIVQDFIKEETGITPSSEVHPDEAVAIGAAYHVLDLLKNQQAAFRRAMFQQIVDDFLCHIILDTGNENIGTWLHEPELHAPPHRRRQVICYNDEHFSPLSAGLYP